MTQSVAPPQPPTNPETIKAPTLELATVPFPEAPADFYQRCKEVAKVVKQFVRTTPSLKMRLDGKKYAYAPVWQFAAACFGITPMVTSTEELLTDDRKEMGYIATAHAIDRPVASSPEPMRPACAPKRIGKTSHPFNSDRWPRPAPVPRFCRTSCAT